MNTVQVTLSGIVTYKDYKGGDIALFIEEDHSESCGESENSFTIATPGNTVGEVVIDAPGTFQAEVTVSYINGSAPPTLDITAFHNTEQDAGDSCTAGGDLIAIPSQNTDDLEIVLEPGFCPIRI